MVDGLCRTGGDTGGDVSETGGIVGGLSRATACYKSGLRGEERDLSRLASGSSIQERRLDALACDFVFPGQLQRNVRNGGDYLVKRKPSTASTV